MALSIAECRKNRGNAKGTITRAGNQVSLFLRADIITLDLSALGRISDSIERADDSFQLHHDTLRMELDGLSEEEYLQEGQEHQILVSGVRLNISILKARHSTTQSMMMLENALASLEIDCRDDFSPGSLDDLARVKAMNVAFVEASSNLLLSTEVVFSTARRDVSKRLKDIELVCLPHLPTTPGTPTVTDKSHSVNPHAIKVKMPKFDGKMLNWKDFWSLFDAMMKKNPHLPPESQRVLLLEAMDSPDSIALAREALSYTTTYEEAALRLRKNYENKKELHTHHVSRLLQPELFKNTRQDLKRMLHRVEKHTAGIQAANGYTLDQVIATHLASFMSPLLLSEWKKHSGKLTDPPALPALKEFIEEQIQASADPSDMRIDEDPPPSRKKQPSPRSPGKSVLYGRKAVECRMCHADHSVFVCPLFTGMTVPDRRIWAETESACFNCLSPSHLVDACPSSFRCKSCGQKHHSLLHPSSTQTTLAPTSASVAHSINSSYVLPITTLVRVKAGGLIQQA